MTKVIENNKITYKKKELQLTTSQKRDLNYTSKKIYEDFFIEEKNELKKMKKIVAIRKEIKKMISELS